jgi:glutaredoxin-like protein NrdH
MTPTIYTKPNCVQCEATKRYFDNKGVAYTTVDITQDVDALDRLIEEGYQAAPVVNAGTEWWSGFQPDKIDKYISDYA